MIADTSDMKSLSVDRVDYVIALPNWKTDYIQGKIASSCEPYELAMLRSMSERLEHGDLVLDVGANIGNHTLYLAAVTGCRVHSFEPNALLCRALQQSIEANGLSASVWVHSVGVGSATGKARFAHEDETNLGGQSLSLDSSDGAAIDVIRLDDLEFDEPVTAIKVDVEGMELDVLEGAKDLIARDSPLLYIECQKQSDFYSIAQWLAAHGYSYRQSYNATPTHLFIHQAQLAGPDFPEQTLIELRGDLYDRDSSIRETNERLNSVNLKYREANQRIGNLKEELASAVERERELREQANQLRNQLAVAQQSPTYVLRKHLSRLKRRVRTPGGLRYLVLCLGVHLLRSPLYLRALLKRRLLRAPGLVVNQSIVPPRNLDELNIEPLKSKSGKELRVACVMDDFTWSSYAPECQLTQLTPINWQAELEECQPELLFIESAWRGKDQLWGSKVGHTSQELQEILRWCRERHIPTMFWNKEDPVHFETFLNTARLFDYVFTTDIDCVPRYKAALGHGEIYFLPFACQPREHNPFEKYVRKDAFCFAGAYYARYPERTRDLEDFVRTFPKYRPLEIYDRNHGKDDPNYKFPEAFWPHIVGTLPFSEIDKAYKGYRYAINLNSIKQSQTMFARRVYELLASNTLTVSNYSRGLRLMFGDLVLSSDNGKQLVSELESLEADGKTDRVRLAALRKVLSEHTYEDRLAYALSRITQLERKTPLPTFRMVGLANSEQDVSWLLEQWKRQKGVGVSLTIVHAPGLTDEQLAPVKQEEGSQVTWLASDQLQGAILSALAKDCDWIAGISTQDYYGPNYLLDIALTTRYREVQVLGKRASYTWSDDACHLAHQGTEYRPAETLLARCSAIQTPAASEIDAAAWLNGLEHWQYKLNEQFAIDRFNYCSNVPNGPIADRIAQQVDDFCLDHGLALEELNKAAESSEPKKDVENGSHALSGALLGRMITRKSSYADHLDQHTDSKTSAAIQVSKNPAIEAEIDGVCLTLSSRMPDGQHEYLYCPENIPIEKLSTDIEGIRQQGLPIHLEIEPGLNLSLVVLFFDFSGKRIENAIEPANRNAVISIPENATSLRLGLRVYAAGSTTVRRLVFGHKHLEPGRIFGKSDVLLLTNNYPSYEDLYRNGFVHSRVKGYKQHGVNVDVFRFRPQEPTYWQEFQNIDSITGSQEALHRLLGSGNYRHVLVHFLDEQMWEVLQDYIVDIKVTIWVHGAEIHPWYRRKYNIETPAQEKKAKEESERRISFWRRILNPMDENLKLVFVSNHFSEEVMEDLGFRLPELQCEVINNPINTELFNYVEKDVEQRKKILSIRPFASRQYANDLTVAIIVKLSKLPYFKELEFKIVGDGPLFDEVVEPLKRFNNVVLEKRFVSQQEISSLHKEYGIFMCPTRWDSQGVSRDEAMSSGLVPITSSVAAVKEFVDDDVAILDNSESIDKLVNGIDRLYHSPKDFSSMSYKAQKLIRDKRSLNSIIKRELSVFTFDAWI
ncbi:FkbM family methyltransferase [Halomonas sp. M4R1S46]|uniref:FkbM family methyltransferase n=1 Tax=Halomonas sp. M4R1S46 TaxID=2982692 RepID=UPI0021E3719A|nr:FkbM family methyltransferase [Halomonas sp. M4R1S46]UYG06035.1 FkbM family methyltransferase [Halomonas sp. M4R1S46]